MKILHITFSDGHGGADIAAMRLHHAMNKWGSMHKDEHGQNLITSSILVQNRMHNDETVFTFGKIDRKILQIIRRKIEEISVKNREIKYGLYSPFLMGHDISGNRLVKEADIIYLHWICGGFLNINNVKALLDLGKPVYRFCHDMFPITGGCHHAFSCDGYSLDADKKNINCKNCQFFPKGLHNKKLVLIQFKEKKRLAEKFPELRFIAPSLWLAECIKKSQISFKHDIYCIKHPIDHEVFRPIDGSACKKLLGIDANKKVVAFGAYGALTNIYKGYDYLRRALSILKKSNVNNITVLLFGSSYNKTIEGQIPYETKFTGILYDELSLAAVYNAADVYVVSSLAESLSNTTVESMCCGTPVAGFDIGGIKDLINEKTGELCKYKDADSLAEGIRKILENGKSYYCTREFIVSSCSTDAILKKHIAMWYKDGVISNEYIF